MSEDKANLLLGLLSEGKLRDETMDSMTDGQLKESLIYSLDLCNDLFKELDELSSNHIVGALN